MLMFSTRSHDYGEPKSYKAKVVPDVRKPLHIERPVVEPIPWMLKGSAKHLMVNPNVRFTHNYSIVEYLAQIPCVMSALDVIQSRPSQRSVFLTTIGAMNLKNSLIVTFGISKIKKRLPHHMDFQIKYTY